MGDFADAYAANSIAGVAVKLLKAGVQRLKQENAQIPAAAPNEPIWTKAPDVSPAILRAVTASTGLQASSFDDMGKAMIRLQVPAGVDREQFVDSFLAMREKAGLGKASMPIQDNFGGRPGSDPQAFYIESKHMTPDVLQKLQANQAGFHAILPTAAKATIEGTRQPAKPGPHL